MHSLAPKISTAVDRAIRCLLCAFAAVYFVCSIDKCAGQDSDLGLTRLDTDKKLDAKSLDRILVDDVAPDEKAVVAAIFAANMSVAQSHEYLENADSSLSVKLLVAWLRVQTCAKAELIQENVEKTQLSVATRNEFLSEFQKAGIKVPDGWRKLIQTGAYLSNDYFFPFDATAIPPRSEQIRPTAGKAGVLSVTDGQVTWHCSLPVTLQGLEAIGGIRVGDSSLVLLEDRDEAWSYWIVKIDSKGYEWSARVESYWVFPEGSGSSVELTVSNDAVYAFCSTPSSLAVNGFALRTGKRLASFSTKWSDLFTLKLDLEKRRVAKTPDSE